MDAVTLDPPSSPTRLLNVNFLLLWQGQLVSQIGNQAFLVVMMYWTKERTGSASLMGLLLMLSSLPALFLGPIAGAFADRHSRRLIILGADLVRGLDLLALAALMVVWHGSQVFLLVVFFAVAVFNAVVNAIFAPAMSAVIPDIVPKARIRTANSLDQFSSRMVSFLAQGIAGTLYRLLGAPVLCFLDAMTFLVSALSLTVVKIPQVVAPARPASGRLFMTYLSDTGAGLRYVRQQKGMWEYLWTAAALNFFFMPIFVLLPFYVERALGAGVDTYGYLMAAFAAGGLLGAALPGLLRSSRSRGSLTMVLLIALSLFFALLAGIHSVPLALLLLFAIGASSSFVNVIVVSLFQAATPSEMRGRVMGLLIAMSRAVSPLGMALGGILGDLAHGDVPRIYFVCGLATFAIMLGMVSQRQFRSFLLRDEERA